MRVQNISISEPEEKFRIVDNSGEVVVQAENFQDLMENLLLESAGGYMPPLKIQRNTWEATIQETWEDIE